MTSRAFKVAVGLLLLGILLCGDTVASALFPEPRPPTAAMVP